MTDRARIKVKEHEQWINSTVPRPAVGKERIEVAPHLRPSVRDRFVMPYTRVVDNKFLIGFKGGVEVGFPLDRKPDQQETESQASLLAAQYAHALLSWLLLPNAQRRPIDHLGVETDGS